MAEMVNQAHNDFWRPPAADVVVSSPERSETCRECRTEFIVGSRYCHCCGASRPAASAAKVIEIPGLLELTALGKRLGLPMPALIALLFGAFCLIAALSVGLLFTARTALDWQAIQFWRIEWLLAGIAAFAAGLLLKKTS